MGIFTIRGGAGVFNIRVRGLTKLLQSTEVDARPSDAKYIQDRKECYNHYGGSPAISRYL